MLPNRFKILGKTRPSVSWNTRIPAIGPMGEPTNILYRPRKFSAKTIGNLATWYDVKNAGSLFQTNGTVATGGSGVALVSDLSGNSGVNALVKAGGVTAGNNASTPHSSAVGQTGSLTIRARLSMNTWSDAALPEIWCKLQSAGQRCYDLYVDATAHLVFRFSTNGTAVITYTSNALSFSAYQTGWVAATYDTATGNVKFYTAADTGNNVMPAWPSGWTQLGTTVAGTAGPIFGGTQIVTIGEGATNYLNGIVYYADLLNGYDGAGSIQAKFDPSTASKLASSFVASTGETWTINTSGDTGARICGARDLVNLTVAKQPVYLLYSGTIYGYINATAGFTFSAPTTSLTGNQTITADVMIPTYTPAANLILFTKLNGNNGISLTLLTTGKLRLTVGNGSSLSTYDSSVAITALNNTRHTLQAVLTDNTNVIFNVDGAQLGTTVAVAVTMTDGSASATVGTGLGFIYSVVVAGKYNFNPSAYTSGTTFVAPTTGETWTINGGASIVTRNGIYGNGTSHYLATAGFVQAQPITLYGVLKQNAWTSTHVLFDGRTATTMQAVQTTSSPQLNINAGSSVAGNTGLVLQTAGVFTAVFSGASSLDRVNLVAAVTGSAGTGAPNGVTLFATATPSLWFNGTIYEFAMYTAAHDTVTQNRIIAGLALEWGISV